VYVVQVRSVLISAGDVSHPASSKADTHSADGLLAEGTIVVRISANVPERY
jgi:hypothetical protein